MPASSIKRLIDWKQFELSKEYLQKQVRLKHSFDDSNMSQVDKRIKPELSDIESCDRYYVTELCLPYNPPPMEGLDLFVFYDDMQALSGSSGYLRIREGYVVGSAILYRS